MQVGRKRSILLLDPSIRERVTRPSESLQRIHKYGTGNGVEEPLQTGSPAVTLWHLLPGGSMYSRANIRALNVRVLPSSKVGTKKVLGFHFCIFSETRDPNWMGMSSSDGNVECCVTMGYYALR